MSEALDRCQLIYLPRFNEPRGNLTVIESNKQIPFDIKRVYYLYDVPGGATRAGHAHHKLEQFLVALAGSFTAIVDDGTNKRVFTLNRSYYGLYIPPMLWRELVDFSSCSVCLSVVSALYDEADYIRSYDEFLRVVKETK